MRESSATAVGVMRRQNVAGIPAPPSRILRPPRPFAQGSPRAASKIYSTLLPSRISGNSLKTNDRGTLYPSQNREAFFSRTRPTLHSRSSSAQITSRGFLSQKELECNDRLESNTWKSEGGFSWQLILL